MSGTDTSNSKFDQYLAQIESRERSKRRRYQLVAVIGILCLLGGGGWWYFQAEEPQILRQYEASSLSYSMVKNLFDDAPGEIVVAHPAIGVDTIYSPEDYLSLRGLLDQLESNSLQASEMIDVEVPPTYAVDIAGSRETGARLIFTIENYDESLTYIMDFGNDYRREVGRRVSYAYNYPGDYRLRLIATNDQGSSSIYNKSIRISRSSGSGSQDNEQPVIASNEAPSDDAEDLDDSISMEEIPSSPGLSSMRGVPIGSPQIETDAPELRSNVPAIEDPGASSSVPSSMDPLLASDVPPDFPGGIEALGSFIRSNYRYPRAAQNANIEGKVYIRFVVNADGSISDPKVIRGIGGGCDEEAIRLVSMMPKWIPGKHEGVPVSVYHTVPITFKLIR